jgi:trehalose synthase
MPDFAQQLPIPQFRIAPSIDPLSDKNKPLDNSIVLRTLENYHVDPGRPILTQISRFDRLKDPLGVIAAYRMLKRAHKCQLVLAGGGASDDPEGVKRSSMRCGRRPPAILIFTCCFCRLQ